MRGKEAQRHFSSPLPLGEGLGVRAVQISDNDGMEMFTLVFIAFAVLVFFNVQAQRRRLVTLAGHLRPYRIEENMEHLLEGYLRAVGEKDPERARHVWTNLHQTEQTLVKQFNQLVQALEQDKTLPRLAPVPFQAVLADKLPNGISFEFAPLMRVHAQGIAFCADHPEVESEADRKQRAFTMSAELLLMQHSCHWFCRSRAMASARLVAKHQTQYTQVLEAVSANTRASYQRAVGAGPHP